MQVGRRQEISQSAVGGAAGEAGSEYRAGVGAYLAAHGLTEAAIGLLEDANLGYPVSLAVEADAAVDDLVCTLSSSTRIFIQAKRKFGRDRHLRAAVGQCISAVRNSDTTGNDLLVIAGEEVASTALDLANALRREREQIAQAPSNAEADALKWLKDLVSDNLDDKQYEELIQRLRIIHAPLSTSGSSLLREAGRLLEGVIVPLGSGPAAMAALAASVRRQGARRYGSNLETWLDSLHSATITVFSDRAGPVGARRQALREMLQEYRQSYAARLDKIRLSGLLDDVGHINLPEFLRDVEVRPLRRRVDSERNRHELVHVIKRWRRICVVGLPGAGKSTALEQLAAAWAADASAPTPILLSLRSLADYCSENPATSSPSDVILASGSYVRRPNAEPLAEELVHKLKTGEAGLLLDGLDECGAARGDVLDTLEMLISVCHSDSAVVLSTRESAAVAAGRLGLSVVELLQPEHLKSNMEELVRQVGSRRYGFDANHEWVRARLRWLQTGGNQDAILWQVPLLATLATVLICEDGHELLPVRRIDILSGAIRASVRDWESRKQRHPDRYRWTENLTPEHLFDAFTIIGHCLITDKTKILDTQTALEAHFEYSWNEPARKAKQIAVEALRFWDELAAIYVLDRPRATISARSRLYAELADALWATQYIDREEQILWLHARMLRSDLQEPIRLAAQINPLILELFIENCTSTRTWWQLKLALAVLKEGVEISTNSMAAVIHALSEAQQVAASSLPPMQEVEGSQDIDRALAKRDDLPWTWTIELCQLKVPVGLRDTRKAAIRVTDEEEQVLAEALMAAADASTDRCEPSQSQVAALRRVLTLPVPAKDPNPIQTSRRRFKVVGSRLKSGRDQATLSAVKLLNDLTIEEAKHADALRGRFGSRAAELIGRTLRRRGFTTDDTRWDVSKIVDIEKMSKRIDNEWLGLVELVSRLDSSLQPADLTLPDLWAVPHLSAVVDLLALGSLSNWELEHALAYREDFFSVVSLHVNGRGMDASRAAAEARSVLPTINGNRRDTAFLLYTPPSPGNEAEPFTQLPDEGTQQYLVGLVCASPSFLIGRLAYSLLVECKCYSALRFVPRDLTQVGFDQRERTAYLVLDLEQADTAIKIASTWLDGEDPSLRVVACIALASTYRSAGPGHTVIEQLLADPDWTIRVQAYKALRSNVTNYEKPTAETATYWSCPDCGTRNNATEADCLVCHSGTKPRL